MKIKELKEINLSLELKRIPLRAHLLGHEKVESTVKDYMIPNQDNKELEYIVDLFTLTTSEIIDKWFDGEDNADDLNMKL